MALVVYDRVQETTATTGTGSITLGGAVDGFQSFAIVGNGNTTYYCIVNGTQWEVGLGTYSTSGPTLARTTVYSNSNATTTPITLVGASNVFLTYPSERSVNLDASGNVTALGTVTSGVWNGTTIPVAYGGTGVTASSGANSVMLRDAYQNVAINRLNQGTTTVTAAGGTTTLTVASTFSWVLNGTGGQTFKLPDATTLTATTAFEFNNNASGTLTITDNANAVVGTVAPGGAAAVALLTNVTVAGLWDIHAYIPENVTWGTNALNLSTTVITNGTWNGGTIQSGYGGTGLTTFTAANNALYSTSSSALAAGTLPIAAGGTAKTSFTANQVLYGSLSQSSAFTFDGTNLAVTGSGKISNNGSVTSISLGTGDSYSTTASWGILGMDSGATNFKVRMYNGGYYFPFSILNSGVVGIGNVEPALSTYDGNLVVAGSQGTGAGTANTRIQVNTYETVSGGSNGLWFGALTDQTTGVIGSRTATGNIAFQTYNGGWAERMRLSYTGNLGIGTTTPNAKLSVNTTTFTAAANTAQVAIENTEAWSQGLAFYIWGAGIYNSGYASGYIGAPNTSSRLFISGGATVVGNPDGSSWAKALNGTSASFINVGDQGIYFYANSGLTANTIYTPSPRIQITTAGNFNLLATGMNNTLIIGGNTSNANYGAIAFNGNNSDGGRIGFTAGGSGDGNLYTDVTGSGNFVYRVAAAEVMRLLGTGAVSFGGSSTNYGSSGQLLQSNGNASPSWINQSSITAGSASNVAGLVANTYSTYTNIASTTAKGGFYGMLCGTGSNYPALMFDGSGGGIYKENTGFWALYYSYGNSCVGIGNSGTTAGYVLQVNGNAYATGSIVAAGNVTADSFVDSNSAYYLNLNGVSNFGTVITGYAQFQSNYNTASGSSPPLQAYSTGGAGAVMAFHRAGVYGLNFGLDSDNILRIGGWSAPANRWQLDMSGNNTIAGYMSATIYYDNPNSSYYVDPDSTSVLYNLTINGTGNKYLRIISTNAQEAMVYYEGSTGTQWYVGKRVTAQLVGTADFHWYNVANNNTMMGLTVAGELLTRGGMYAPAFYDIDNPAYYLNPANRSYLYTFTMGDSNEINQLCTNVTTSSIIGLGFNGSDSSYAIFKSAGAWVQPLNIKFYTGVRLYAAYNYDYGISFWDQVGGGLLMSVGQGDYNVRVSNTIYSAISSSSSAMVSPIYYATNTAYYVQPAADSNIGTITSNNHYIRAGQMLYSDHGGWTGEYNKIQWHGGNMYFQNTSTGLFQFRNSAGTDVISFTTAGAGTFQGTVTAPSGGFNTSASYVSNGQLGLYNASYGGYFYQTAGTEWNATFNGNTNGALALRTSYNSTTKVFLYYDTSGSGLLTNTGNWGVRMNYDGGASPGGTLYGAWIANSTFNASSDISTGTVFRGQVYYDTNNAGYYLDPDSNSVLWRLNCRSAGRGFGGTNTQMEISNAGSGDCVIAFHREGSYGANFGLSSDNKFSTYGWSAGGGYTGLDLGVTYILQNNGTNSVVFLTSRPGVADSYYLFASDAWAPNGNAATQWLGCMSWTGRSINATGSINASGSDYAEYMTKSGDFTIAKGDVCGIDINGELTNVFADAISFVVKSTKPSYVGGDEWGSEEGMGMAPPTEPIRMSEETDESLNARKAQYAIDKPIFDAKFEAARAKVDRIAFSGQVPVNVTGATAGQYIIPVDDNGAIKGVAVNEDDLTMSQYIKAVGKVIKVVDGRPTIIVKVS